MFHCYSALFCRFSLSSEGTRFYFVSVCTSCAVTTCHVYFCCLISLRSFFYLSFVSSSISTSCYLPPRPLLPVWGSCNELFFLNDMFEKNDGMRKKNMLRILWTVLRPQKEVPRMEGTVVLEVFHPLRTVVFSSKMACIDQHSSLVAAEKFSPACPYQQHGNKMAWALEGVKGSALDEGKCRGSRSIGLLSLASV